MMLLLELLTDRKGISMGIKDLFDTQAPRSRQQDNWLKMVAAIPGVKRAFNDPVTPEDEAAADEAKDILGDAIRAGQPS